ncbi:unnamed protein product [Boreogadus saida]
MADPEWHWPDPVVLNFNRHPPLIKTLVGDISAMVEKNCLRAPLARAAGRRQSRPAAVRQLGRCTPGAELAPKLGGSSSGLAAPADEQLQLG